jgi:predicted nuclease of predicted toxin-antitoxin system
LKIWIDAQLSPAIAAWINRSFVGIEAASARAVGLRNALDPEIFFAAREAGTIVMSKDSDFRRLLEEHGPPPQVLWVTCGNTSNARMRQVLAEALPKALELLRSGESLVEISDRR